MAIPFVPAIPAATKAIMAGLASLGLGFGVKSAVDNRKEYNFDLTNSIKKNATISTLPIVLATANYQAHKDKQAELTQHATQDRYEEAKRNYPELSPVMGSEMLQTFANDATHIKTPVGINSPGFQSRSVSPEDYGVTVDNSVSSSRPTGSVTSQNTPPSDPKNDKEKRKEEIKKTWQGVKKGLKIGTGIIGAGGIGFYGGRLYEQVQPENYEIGSGVLLPEQPVQQTSTKVEENPHLKIKPRPNFLKIQSHYDD